jgi:protein-disulfide isomerase
MRNEGIEMGSRPPRNDYRRLRVAVLFGCVVLITPAAACREGPASQEKAVVQQGAPAPGPDAVLASVGDEKITMADVRARSGDLLNQLETQYQIAKSRIVRTALDSILLEKTLTAEMKRTGKTVDELVATEAGADGLTPTDADVVAWYQSNQARLGARPIESVRPQILELLRTEKRKAAEKKLQSRLNTERKVTVAFEPYRLQFDNEKAPTLGKADAPITLVEFSDFQCPFCQAAAPTLKQVEQKFGDKVRIVYRQYPIASLHPFAFKAAEASLCANDQGKFWELHDTMFQDQKKLTVSDLKQSARRLGLDGKKFDACLDAGRYVEQVQNDQKEGQRAGVNGTPAMFINGVYVEGGAVPFSTLELLIQKELARGKAGA